MSSSQHHFLRKTGIATGSQDKRRPPLLGLSPSIGGRVYPRECPRGDLNPRDILRGKWTVAPVNVVGYIPQSHHMEFQCRYLFR